LGKRHCYHYCLDWGGSTCAWATSWYLSVPEKISKLTLISFC
jgi:hypothetical protein